MLPKKIKYSELNSRQKEIYNFQKVAGHLTEFGFNCIKLTDDWQGADFLAYHKDGTNTLKVQLKARLTIDKKYENKELYLAFPINECWYLIEHDKLIAIVRENTNWLNTDSWTKRGRYHSSTPSSKLIAELQGYKINCDNPTTA